MRRIETFDFTCEARRRMMEITERRAGRIYGD
jgi:hypothetical protein